MSNFTIVLCTRCGAERRKYNNIKYKTTLCVACTRSMNSAKLRAKVYRDAAASRHIGAKSLHSRQASSLNARRAPITLARLEPKP